jgi:squalene-hopene/tetraprenyl-beta-curcumene cyclase
MRSAFSASSRPPVAMGHLTPRFGLRRASSVILLMLAVTAWTAAANSPVYDQAPLDLDDLQKLWLKDLPRATPDEALLTSYSEEQAKTFLDDTSLKWARQNRCGTCHTTIPYLMARPLLGGANLTAWNEVRASVSDFASDRIAKHAQDAAFIAGSTVAALAVGDSAGGRPMQPDTRALFDYLWASQGSDGAWVVPQKGMLPFLERDPRYVAIMVALGLGYTTSNYYEDDPRGRAGFAKLRGFIRNNLPTSVHDKAVLLWASIRTPGLLRKKEQQDYTHSILALQRDDGGWALPAMGSWPRHDGPPSDPNLSDGYATALSALVLCQGGYSTKDAPIMRALVWIKRHQRVSGRWYTRSLYSEYFQNYLSNMGTAYAVMALRSCNPRGS